VARRNDTVIGHSIQSKTGFQKIEGEEARKGRKKKKKRIEWTKKKMPTGFLTA